VTLYYTKAGDKGETGVFGKRVRKTDPSIEAIGDIDETNAALGVALAHVDDGQVRQAVIKAQNLMFTVGAELAGVAKVSVKAAHVEELEKTIDAFAAQIEEQTTFLLPNGTKGASFLHLARAVCRRAERAVARLHETKAINPDLLKYLNRLSSLLYVLARFENRKIGETAPVY
jgi:cob(I)alamin adenosyltransferase